MRTDPPYDLDAFLARNVPIAAAMGIRLRSYGPAGLALAAPLAPNVNDKGIAFGGSLASLLALAGWALTDFTLRAAGVEADIIIASTRIAFLRPVRGEIVATCPRPPEERVARLLADWRGRSRARWELEPAVVVAEGAAASARSVYAVVPRPSAP